MKNPLLYAQQPVVSVATPQLPRLKTMAHSGNSPSPAKSASSSPLPPPLPPRHPSPSSGKIIVTSSTETLIKDPNKNSSDSAVGDVEEGDAATLENHPKSSPMRSVNCISWGSVGLCSGGGAAGSSLGRAWFFGPLGRGHA